MEPKIWAHRILKRLPRFQFDLGKSQTSENDAGAYIGSYVNNEDSYVAFFEKGFYVSSLKNRFYKYTDINSKRPIESKDDNFVYLEIKDNSFLKISIGYQKDIFELSRFFSRVIEDLK